MSVRTPLGRFKASDLVLMGYLIGLAVYYLFVDTEPSAYNEQDVHLSEEHLQRLERGDTLRMRRWHGHEMKIRADLVVDADSLASDATTDQDHRDGEE